MCSSQQRVPSSLFAGTAVTDVTPPVGYRLAGHAARKAPSIGVHDPLMLKVLTLFDGRMRFALVTSDLIGFDSESVRRVRVEAKRHLGLPAEKIFMNSSHTHTGPCMNRKSKFVPPDHILEHYIRTVEDKLLGAIIEAMHHEEPVRLRYGEERFRIGAINRRRLSEGKVLFKPNPQGPVDEVLNVLRLDRRDGTPLAVLFRYSCHPTVLDAKINLVSADYPGAAQRLVESAYPGAKALFVQGCCGDVRPGIVRGDDFVGGTFDDVERIGRCLACGVIHACEVAQPMSETNLSAGLTRVNLPLDQAKQPRDLRHLARLAREYKQENREFAAWIDRWAAHWRRELRACRPPTKYVPMDTHILQIGAINFVGLAAEVMAQYGDWIREAVGPRTIVAGYTNGDIGYLPTAEALRQGGYEANFHLFENISAPFSPRVQDLVVRSAAGLAERVRAHQRA